ncbi:MAG: hypothetical protein ABSB54_18980, partial [Acidimicrobiales bacterium]
PIATVSQFVYTDTPATLLARTHEAQKDSSALTLVETTLPLSALILGIVLLAAAVLLRLGRPGGPGVRGRLVEHGAGRRAVATPASKVA